MRTYLNDNWQFFKTFDDSIFSEETVGQEVRIPHTVAETPFNCFGEKIYQLVSGYRKNLHLDAPLCGKYLLTFEAVAHHAEVFVNGISAAVHSNGYTAFTVDISQLVHAGDNQIVVKVDSRESLNQPPFGFVIDYLTYGGIYREVYLENYVGAYVSEAFVIAEPDKPVSVEVKLDCSADSSASSAVLAQILDGETVLCEVEAASARQMKITLPEVALQNWDISSPKLYVLRLTADGNVWQTSFGVRSAKFTSNGFFLNGKRTKLVGLNRHQCFPYVGYAMPESMQRRDARILKEQLCVNIVRTSHYPQSQYFLDECDKLGLLVFTEIPGWQHIGNEEWQAQALENVREMITQYRNHPSIVLWGVRINESGDNDALYTETNALAAQLDSTRQTGGVRNFTHSHLLEGVYTFNDFNRNGATDRKNVCSADVPYLVTEYNGHMFPTKTYDDFPHQREHVLRYARMLNDVFRSFSTCGCIGWCMFDYNTHKDFGSGDRICYHGVMDMFRNPKIAAGIFASQGEKPFLDVAFTPDIGDYPEGNVGQMFVLTNADYVDVFQGETFVKRFSHEDSPFEYLPNAPILIDDLIGDRLINEEGFSQKMSDLTKQVLNEIWNASAVADLPFKTKMKILRIMRGTKLNMDQLVALHNKYRNNWGSQATALTVKAFKSDTLVAEKTVGVAVDVAIEAKASSRVLHEGTAYDVAVVNICARDQNGNRVPYISKVVHLRSEGPIEIIGPKDIPLLGGMTGTYVKTVGKTGVAKLFVDDIPVEFEII